MDEQIKKILDILETKDYESFIGLHENHKFECKSQVYVLDEDKQKHELAKDVSALANSDGGIIVFGLKTKKDSERRLDIVDKIRPIDKQLFDTNKMESSLKNWIYPNVEGIEIKMHPVNEDKILCSLLVPHQEGNQLFIVVRHVDDDEKTIGNIFGIFERKRDAVSHRSPQSIHAQLSFAESTNELNERLGNIEELLYQQNDVKQQQRDKEYLTSVEDSIHQKVADAAQGGELNDKPFFSLTCFPSSSIIASDLFKGKSTELVRLLENPPKIRNRGWDLHTYNKSSIVKGKIRRVVDKGMMSIDFHKDGIMIFVGSLDKNNLSWGRYKTNSDVPIINPVAIIEVTLIFVKLCINALRGLSVQKMNFSITLENVGVEGTNLSLRPSFDPFQDHIIQAPSSRGSFLLYDQSIEDNDEAIAFRIISQVFGWFGVEHERIPLTKVGNDGEYVISEKLIVDVNN